MKKVTDLTGKRFGHLTVISRAPDKVLKSGRTKPAWLCRCDCGNTVAVLGESLRHGDTRSCGCAKIALNRETHTKHILPGTRYGHLTVIAEADTRSHYTYYLCQCDCGSKKIIRATDLRQGKTKSCGCGIRKAAREKTEDLTGQRFGRLTVIGRGADYVRKDTGQRTIRWLCRCDCGRGTLVSKTQLKSGKVISCGCYNRELLLSGKAGKKRLQNKKKEEEGKSYKTNCGLTCTVIQYNGTHDVAVKFEDGMQVTCEMRRIKDGTVRHPVFNGRIPKEGTPYFGWTIFPGAFNIGGKKYYKVQDPDGNRALKLPNELY